MIRIRLFNGFTNILASPPSKIRGYPKIEVFDGANKNRRQQLRRMGCNTMVVRMRVAEHSEINPKGFQINDSIEVGIYSNSLINCIIQKICKCQCRGVTYWSKYQEAI